MGLYSGGLIFGGAYIRGGAYIWNDVSVSTCGGLIHGGRAYIVGAYSRSSRRFTVSYIYTAPVYRLLYDDPCIGPYK